MKKVLFAILLCCSISANAKEGIPPFSCCTDVEYIIPKTGTTRVSKWMFEGANKIKGVRDRIYSRKDFTFKSFVLIIFDWERGMGKIYNITDDTHVYTVVYTYENGQSYTEEIEVLPRTFSHMKSSKSTRGNPVKFYIREIE